METLEAMQARIKALELRNIENGHRIAALEAKILWGNLPDNASPLEWVMHVGSERGTVREPIRAPTLDP